MKIYNIAIVLLIITTLSACKKDGDVPQKQYFTPVPLYINVDVGETRIDASASQYSKHLSRSGVTTGTIFGEDAKINVILVDGNGETSTDYPLVAPFVCRTVLTNGVEGITWKPVDASKQLLVTANNAQVLAHYPAVLQSSFSLSTDKRQLEFTLPSNMSYGDVSDVNFNAIRIKVDVIDKEVWFAKGDDDFLVGAGATEVSAKVVGTIMQNTTLINMKHALAMVVVHITMDADNPNVNSTIRSLSIENATLTNTPLQQGSVDIATNNFIGNGNAINYKRQMSGFLQGTYFGMLVNQATIADDQVVIKCVVGVAEYEYKVKAQKWSAGMVYVYNLKLTPSQGVLSDGVKVVNWPEPIADNIELE